MTVNDRKPSVPAEHQEPWRYTPAAMDYVAQRTKDGYTEIEIAKLLRWELSSLRSRAKTRGIELNKPV